MVIFPLGTQTSAFLLEEHPAHCKRWARVGKSPAEAPGQLLKETLDRVTE